MQYLLFDPKIGLILGLKGYVFHACMKRHNFGTRTNMRKKPDRADFEGL